MDDPQGNQAGMPTEWAAAETKAALDNCDHGDPRVVDLSRYIGAAGGSPQGEAACSSTWPLT